jgi:hypothetical protein
MLGFLAQQAMEQLRRFGPDPMVPTTPPAEPPADKIIIGLDVGEVKDFTALNALQMSKRQDENGRTRRHYVSRLLHRWPLRTGYEQIIEDVRQIAQGLPMSPELVLDATGAGRPVAQMFRRAKLPVKRFVPVIITSGTKVLMEPDGYYHVAKRELVSCVLAASQSRRLKIVPTLREAKTLIRELQRFRCKINVATGNESFEAWRERDHDDLVLATALALWHGEQGRDLRAEHFHLG